MTVTGSRTKRASKPGIPGDRINEAAASVPVGTVPPGNNIGLTPLEACEAMASGFPETDNIAGADRPLSPGDIEVFVAGRRVTPMDHEGFFGSNDGNCTAYAVRKAMELRAVASRSEPYAAAEQPATGGPSTLAGHIKDNWKLAQAGQPVQVERVHPSDVVGGADHMLSDEFVEDLHNYHNEPWKSERFAEIRRACAELFQEIVRQCPRCADRTRALNAVREVRMWANSSIALDKSERK